MEIDGFPSRDDAWRQKADDIAGDLDKGHGFQRELRGGCGVNWGQQHELVDQATHRGDVMLQARGVVMVEPVKFERQHRERRAQFMRDIGGKIFLAHGGLVKTAEQIVDGVRERQGFGRHMRSEEHTSELQSLMRISYAVLCLKKKNTTNN